MCLEGAISCAMVRQLRPDDILEEYPGLLQLCLLELPLGRMGGACEEFPGSTGTRWLQLPSGAWSRMPRRVHVLSCIRVLGDKGEQRVQAYDS